MSEVLGGVLVTGAGGFIGGHIVRHLRQAGQPVTPATRDGRGGTVALDLRNPAAIAPALAGIDAIVHCAVGNRAVTVDGTAALLRAAAAAGVKRVVHISSVAVYGAATGTLLEDAPLVPPGPTYAGLKAEAEALCLAAPGVQTVRLRPAIVYGAGSRLWVEHLAQRIRAGRWGTFGRGGEGICNLVHVSDVAAATAASLVHAGIDGHAFNVNGPEPLTWNEWFTRLAQAIGAGPLPALSAPALALRAAAALPLKALARLRPGLARTFLLGAPAGSERRLFALRAHYPVDAAARLMNWRPTVPLAEGLADSAAWLRSQGLA